jgi:hypothetical protein
MTRNFSELETKMSSSARLRVDQKVRKAMAEMQGIICDHLEDDSFLLADETTTNDADGYEQKACFIKMGNSRG